MTPVIGPGGHEKGRRPKLKGSASLTEILPKTCGNVNSFWTARSLIPPFISQRRQTDAGGVERGPLRYYSHALHSAAFTLPAFAKAELGEEVAGK